MTVTFRQEGDIAIVTIDNPPVNAVSYDVRMGLVEAVAQADAADGIHAVILCCAGRTFVAGADIREFGKPPAEPFLPEVIQAIENAGKPWVAAIHGTALGGGLEIAMGCRARVAVATARFGLPEVNLGLLPGAGGTVRLPRLIPAEAALRMIAGGNPIGAREALHLGLVDAITEDDLMSAARDMVDAGLAADTTLERPVRQPEDRLAIEEQVAGFVKKARGQQSIKVAAESVLAALDATAEDALTRERSAFLALKSSEQSEALRHIFFAERTTLLDRRCKGPTREVTAVGVVGGGTMGAGIAAAFLLRGFSVRMAERDDESAKAGVQRVAAILADSRKRGILDDASHQAALGRFSGSPVLGTLDNADLVIEAVFEDMDAKREVFARLDEVARADAILATNTSYLDVNDIASVVRDPSRVIGLHFFSPAHVMKLLEIVVPAQVSDDVVATAAALSKRLGKIGVLSGVADGFIGNRIMSAYRQEADFLIEDGALPWQVDAAMRAYGFGIGVFQMQDLAGLDIAWAMRKRRAPARDPSARYVSVADRLCEASHFGRKTGKGWYVYEDGIGAPSPETEAIIAKERAKKGIVVQTFTDDAIMDRLLTAMQREGAAVLDEGIARAADDIDVVMINGYGFPRWRGGPMFAARQSSGAV